MITVGVDEVGRGCWAGPVVAGAVILDSSIAGLTDSKLLTKRRRHDLATVIKATAKAYGLGWVEASHVDQLGLTAAVRLAMQRALEQIGVAYDEVIIDGNLNFLADYEPKARSLIKADALVPAVSAASILAKVARDDYMSQTAHQKFPAYGFDQHVGYGTSLHLRQLKAHGVTELHRLSFKPVKALL